MLAVRTHASEATLCPSEQLRDSAIPAADWSPVRCRSRAAILVALVTFGAVCQAQMPRPDVSDDKSCETELANCQALLGTVLAKEAKDVLHLAAITPSSSSRGARSRICLPPFGLRMRGLHDRRQPVPCRAECARRQEHERHRAGGQRTAVSGAERNQLRGEVAGVSSARQGAQAVMLAPRIRPPSMPTLRTLSTLAHPWIDRYASMCVLCAHSRNQRTYCRHAYFTCGCRPSLPNWIEHRLSLRMQSIL